MPVYVLYMYVVITVGTVCTVQDDLLARVIIILVNLLVRSNNWQFLY